MTKPGCLENLFPRVLSARYAPHTRSRARAHDSGITAQLPGLPLQDRDELIRAHITGILSSFSFRKLAFGGLGGQLLYSSLKFRIAPKTQDGFRPVH